MRTYLITLTIIRLCIPTFAQDVTMSGVVKDWKTGETLSNVKIEFSRIGNNIITKDTVTTESDGTYSYVYPFETIKYEKKYETITFRALNTSTHWFYTRNWKYLYKNVFPFDIIGIPNTYPENSTVRGYIKHSNTPVQGINVLFTQINEDSTETKDTILTTDINGLFSTYVNIKKYKSYKLKPISDKYTCKYLSNYSMAIWSNQLYEMCFDFKATPIDTSYITISGKTTINTLGYKTNLRFNETPVSSDRDGNYIHYIPKGWSGTIMPDTLLYTWTPGSITLTNVQENQIINFTGNKITHTISGYVYIDEGDSIEFTFIDFDGFGRYSAITDSTGYYSIELDYYTYLPNIIPIKKGHTFSPDTLKNIKCITDIVVDFIATSNEKILISGTINDNSRGGIDSVLINFSGINNGQCFTGPDGYFSHLLRIGWSGTIIPTKEGVVFDPPEIPMSNIDTNTIISTIAKDTLATKIINGKSLKLNKQTKLEFEIAVYSPSGRLIGKAMNMKAAQLLHKKATGLYIYQLVVKNTIIQTKNMILIK